MGRQSRRKRDRRLQRQRNERLAATPHGGEPLRILRSIHKTIQGHCHESPRSCWEYLLEMLAHLTGWRTDTAIAKHLHEKMWNERRWLEFAECWLAEVTAAAHNKTSFSEPIGELLEEIESTNENLGQFFTPMQVVRLMNDINLSDSYAPPQPNGMPSRRGMDPCCGTGRFMLDALVHDDGIMMHGVDLDLWLLRAAMVNVRLLSRWTSCYVRDPADRLQPFTAESKKSLRKEGVSLPEEEGGVLMIGGRSIFIHGDALRVDLNNGLNWLISSWFWTPLPWESSLKINGFDGTLEDLERQQRPAPRKETPPVNFDYSLNDKATG